MRCEGQLGGSCSPKIQTFINPYVTDSKDLQYGVNFRILKNCVQFYYDSHEIFNKM
jgi:hypothetical protein